HDLATAAGHRGDRRSTLQAAMTAIQAYERDLSRHLLTGLAKLPRYQVWGITDPERLDQRVPTVSVTVAGVSAETSARQRAAGGCAGGNGVATCGWPSWCRSIAVGSSNPSSSSSGSSATANVAPSGPRCGDAWATTAAFAGSPATRAGVVSWAVGPSSQAPP